MSNLSSIHFKKSTRFQVYHNDKIRPSYVIDSVDKVECNRPSEEARLLCDDMIEKAKQRYYETSKARNKNFQSTNYLQSAVVNIKESTTMDDLEKLANYFQNKYGFQCYQISIHRDEGHINDNGEKVINHHAHMEFVTLDKETGKSCFRLNKADLRKIQDITAQELGMMRGNPGAKRIEPRKWAILKEQEKANTKALKQDLEQVKAENKALKQDLASQKAVNTAFEEIRQLMIADGISTADDYKELAKYKKEAQAQAKNKQLIQEELNNQIAQIKLSYDKKLKEAKEQALEQLKTEMDERAENQLENDLDIYLNQAETPKDKELIKRILILDNLYVSNARIDINKLKNENDSLKKLADNKPNSQNNSDDEENQIKLLQEQNQSLKEQNQTLKSELFYIKQFLENNKLIDRIKSFFSSIGKKLSMEFEEPKVQAPNHAEQKQDIQLTPIKSAWEIKRDEKNKGRGGRV